MATYTTFLHLEKPSTSERLDVLKINSNWDLIDAGVSALNSQLVGMGALSALPSTINDGIVAFALSQDVTLDGTTLPGGIRFIGYVLNGTGHFIGEANSASIYTIRKDGTGWHLLSQTTKILAKGSVDDGTVTHDFSALSARNLAIVVCTNALFIVTKWGSNATANPAYRDTGVTYSTSGNVLTISGVATGGYSIIAI